MTLKKYLLSVGALTAFIHSLGAHAQLGMPDLGSFAVVEACVMEQSETAQGKVAAEKIQYIYSEDGAAPKNRMRMCLVKQQALPKDLCIPIVNFVANETKPSASEVAALQEAMEKTEPFSKENQFLMGMIQCLPLKEKEVFQKALETNNPNLIDGFGGDL
jgi:hypothetical protein